MDIKKIDIEELTIAFEDNDIEHRYYLDLETGKVEFISDWDKIPEMEELDKKIEEGFGKRYISIPQIPSYEAYGYMREFIYTVEDEELKEKLYIAIDGKGAFRRFKDVLLGYPEERERWFKFKDNKIREEVMEWLKEEGLIDPGEMKIEEATYEDLLKIGIDDMWKGFGPVGCLECGYEGGFETRYFIISRLPVNQAEEEKLEVEMDKKFGVGHFGVNACVLSDGRSVLDAARCKRCGSWEVFFDF
jgi:hypothetical protein